MNIENLIRDAFNELVKDGDFQIDQINYDEKNFGNVCATLTSKEQFNIRFIKDRGTVWCELGQAGEWYFIEDIFTLIGGTFMNETDDLIDFITETTSLIKIYIPQISLLFNEKNFMDTQIKIKEVARKRAMGMFNLK